MMENQFGRKRENEIETMIILGFVGWILRIPRDPKTLTLGNYG